jgi:phosphoheptose isomerase
LNQYDRFVKGTEAFVARHVRRSADAVTFVARCIASIARGREGFESIALPERLAVLTGGS